MVPPNFGPVEKEVLVPDAKLDVAPNMPGLVVADAVFVAPPNGCGAFADIGGYPEELDDAAAGAPIGVGAFAEKGGYDEELCEDFGFESVVPMGVGAAFDMGGYPDDVEVFPTPSTGFGALFDMGG